MDTYSDEEAQFAAARRTELMAYIKYAGKLVIMISSRVETANVETGHLKGMRTKNLFLKSKKGTLYLVTARDNVKVDLKAVAKLLNASGGVRFADPEVLRSSLSVLQGSVTPLSLFFDKEHVVQFAVDDELLADPAETLWFHPMSNDATVGMRTSDFVAFLTSLKREPLRLKL